AQVDPGAVAAIIIEPVQGEAGFIPMPKAFLEKIRGLCDTHGIVMIADEIQSGFGRTGKLFAIEHAGVVPDLITTAKSLGSGMPVSAVTGKAEIMDTPHPGAVGGTYSGGPVVAVAAVETIKMISHPAFLKRAEAVGEMLRTIMEAWKSNYSYIGDVRGVGGMRLIEFVKDRETREPFPELVAEIVSDAVTKGILLIRAGLFSNCMRLLPPFSITDEQLHEGMAVLEDAVKRAHDKRLPPGST
ncbi:MAG: aminotransferase class III-fold pyridoxal phosphate-dependent enzyme, partial [Sinomicrobium sp.]|nr:aminotransferase class III-fold pyridoxal phosphate-dependent enzyme [Sinomicrobium sp.]